MYQGTECIQQLLASLSDASESEDDDNTWKMKNKWLLRLQPDISVFFYPDNNGNKATIERGDEGERVQIIFF